MHEQSTDFSKHDSFSTLKPDETVYNDLVDVPHPEMTIRFNHSHTQDLTRAPSLTLDENHRRYYMNVQKQDEIYYYTSAELAAGFLGLVETGDYWAARDLLYSTIVTIRSSPLENAVELLEINLEVGNQDRATKNYNQLKPIASTMKKQLPALESFIAAIEPVTQGLVVPEADRDTKTKNGGTIEANIADAKAFLTRFQVSLKEAQAALGDYEVKYSSPS